MRVAEYLKLLLVMGLPFVSPPAIPQMDVCMQAVGTPRLLNHRL